MHKKLFIPGPIETRKEVLEKMATPMIGHRTKEASALQRGISDKLRKLFYTKNEILLSTSSGSGLMEGAIRCATKKRAAVFSVGSFGKRWYEMAVANNVPADIFAEEDGFHTDPHLRPPPSLLLCGLSRRWQKNTLSMFSYSFLHSISFIQDTARQNRSL